MQFGTRDKGVGGIYVIDGRAEVVAQLLGSAVLLQGFDRNGITHYYAVLTLVFVEKLGGEAQQSQGQADNT